MQMKMRTLSNVGLKAWLVNVLLSVVGLALTLALWQLASELVGRYMPPPLPVFENMISNFSDSRRLQGLGLQAGGYLPHLMYTVWNVTLGVTIGVSIGTITGLASWRWRVVDEITDPIVTIFGTLPILVAAPFFLIWFGLVAFAQVSLVAFYATVILHLYTLRATRNVDPRYRDYALTLGASDGALFRRIMVPAALPEVVGGIRIALAAAWGLAAIAELLGAQFGVGRVIVSLTAVYDVESIMAIVLLLSAVAVLLDVLVLGGRAWATRWMPREARRP
jgi:ABC-type nitrate/sulfonate/bicarbonate transport system permease component